MKRCKITTCAPKILLLCCALLLADGCAYFSRIRFTVEPSSLDYVQFRQTEIVVGDEPPYVKSLELGGSGYLEYSRGKSERVTNDFWQESSSPHLNDIQTDFRVLTQDETVAIFQRMVDAGVFDGHQRDKARPDATKLLVLARMHFEKKVIVTTNPVYLEIYNELLAKFRE